MKTAAITLHALLALALLSGPAEAQFKFFNPRGSFAVEVSLENPGPDRLRLPIYRNAITSLAVVGDYAVGGTSAAQGLTPFIFTASLSRRSLEQAFDLGQVLPGQRSVQSGFARGTGGVLYAGTMPDDPQGSGHLIKVRVPGGKVEVADLGVPVA
ncbi:MAG: hypothetical protein JXQ83_13710, partial [Candidatus Glassbacteria bacterium]|nr:hypothetical protein [Candidatus Glassbacteria bacterium]